MFAYQKLKRKLILMFAKIKVCARVSEPDQKDIISHIWATLVV